MARIDISGIKNIQRKLAKIENLDATPLMFALEQVVEEQNRKGIMAGTDGDGGYLLAVSYRPRGEPVNIRTANADSKRMRNGAKGNSKRGAFSVGPMSSGLHGNLSSSEYRRLNGPPLAPRGVFSRVITNFVTSFVVDPTRRIWTVVAGWKDVVSTRGVPFLKFHFNGEGQLQRDLRGVRPEGMRKAKQVTTKWLKDLIRSTFG